MPADAERRSQVSGKGPQIALSRTHPNLVRSLFKLEVPEIADGTVEIAATVSYTHLTLPTNREV